MSPANRFHGKVTTAGRGRSDIGSGLKVWLPVEAGCLLLLQRSQLLLEMLQSGRRLSLYLGHVPQYFCRRSDACLI